MYNKVEYNGETLIDLTDTTAEESDVLQGKQFHDRSGALRNGNFVPQTYTAGAGIDITNDEISAKVDGTSTVFDEDGNIIVNLDVIATKAFVRAVNDLANYYLKSDVDGLLDDKQDISLAPLIYSIRNGKVTFADGTTQTIPEGNVGTDVYACRNSTSDSWDLKTTGYEQYTYVYQLGLWTNYTAIPNDKEFILSSSIGVYQLLRDEIRTKVDKVAGKGLSTNDFTTAEKTKLAGIEAEANKTVVDEELSSTSENPVQNKVVSQNSANSETKEVSGKTVVINDISSNPHTIKISGSANDEVNIFGKNLFNSFLQEDKPDISTPLYVDTDGSICRVNSGSGPVTTTYLTYNSNDYATLKAGKSYSLFVSLNNNTLSNAYATIKYADETTSTLECNTFFTPAQDCVVRLIQTHQIVSFPANATSRIQIMVVMAKNNDFKYERYKGVPIYEPYQSKQTITLDENGKGECASRFPHITLDCNSKINVVYNSNLNYPKISYDCLFEGAYNGGTISTDVFATVADLYSAYDTLLGTENRKLIGYATATDGTADTNYPLYEYTLPCPFEPTNDILSAPTILISAGIHSDEKTSIMATYRFIEQVKNGSNTNAKAIRYANTIKVVPCCNPYGYDHTTTQNEGRVNARGVNLNRNFGYNWYAYIPDNAQNNKGTAPYSELETQALRNWIENNSGALFHIDMHNHGYSYSYALTYVATNSLLQRQIFSKMVRSVAPAIYSQRSVGLWSSTHFLEDNLIAGIASESWFLNDIQSAILEQPYGNSSQVSGTWIPFEVDILGNYIMSNLKGVKKVESGEQR